MHGHMMVHCLLDAEGANTRSEFSALRTVRRPPYADIPEFLLFLPVLPIPCELALPPAGEHTGLLRHHVDVPYPDRYKHGRAIPKRLAISYYIPIFAPLLV